MLDIIGQVVAAGFLASLDDNDAASVWHTLLAQAAQRGQRAEHSVAVIGAPAAVKLVAFEPRDPRAIALRPADHFRLLVEMPIEPNGIASFPRHLDQHQGRSEERR